MTHAKLDDELMAEFAAVAESAGCELVDARFRGGMLRVVLDHRDGVTLEHCQTVSKQVSALLDVADWGRGRYTLEVTSPGLDRELVRPADFRRFAGSLIKVTWQPPDGKRTVVGTLAAGPAEDAGGQGEIEVRVGPEESYHIALQSIQIARLVPEL
ncbi:MAG: ribosome maturation factor RimP [Acidobacteriota bacterium]|nr:ribosome maturation factor RimP [Acidobacteriota bacterium]MDH3523397.1 ribosome maturation factor RimP [Acidobacteriota bacterium]